MGHRTDWTGATARVACWWRQGGLCGLCWEPLGTLEEGRFEAHHRERRRDLPGWCPCNIVVLHPRCHTQGPAAVHDHPDMAAPLGLIVAAVSMVDPRDVAMVVRWPWEGEGYLDCDGMVVSPHAPRRPLAEPQQQPLPWGE
jgi:hypothetical protein